MNNDNQFQKQEVQNSLQGLESGGIGKRLLYLSYILLGVLFFVIGLLTLYNVLAVYTLKVNDQGVFRSSLFLCYVFLSFVTAYGFLFCRRWLLSIMAVQAFLMISAYLLTVSGLIDGYAGDKIPGAILFSVLALFLYVTRKYLNGLLYKKIPVISFVIVLLVSFFITTFNLI